MKTKTSCLLTLQLWRIELVQFACRFFTRYIIPSPLHYRPHTPVRSHLRRVGNLWLHRSLYSYRLTLKSDRERAMEWKSKKSLDNGMFSFSFSVDCGCLGNVKMKETIGDGAKMSLLPTNGMGGSMRGTMKRWVKLSSACKYMSFQTHLLLVNCRLKHLTSVTRNETTNFFLNC